jgi:hypothetical protein
MSPRRGAALAAAAFVLLTAESLRAPMGYTVFPGIPRIYDLLAAERDAVVIEFPFPSPRFVARNGAYVLASTRHWKPVVNGYSGFVPESYVRHNELFRTFPDEAALANLRQAGVTHVVLHLAEMPGTAERLDERPGVKLLGSSRDIRIYRLEK